MDEERFNRQMEFIINQQAQFSADIIELKSQLTELTGTVANLAGTVGNMAGIVEVVAGTVEGLAGTVRDMAETVEGLKETVEIHRADTQEAINNLIVANEVTRDLTQKVARLAMQTSQRVIDLESKQ